MHPRLTELLDYLDAKRTILLDAASALPPDRWTARPAPDRWSVSEICWHLQKVETNVAKLIARRAAEAREKGHPSEDADDSTLGALDAFRVVDRTVRMQSPPQLAPMDIPNAEMVQQQLNESRALLRAAIADADGLALGRITHPHPVFGEFDLYQWILFVAQHEERHARQIAETTAVAASS